MPILDAVPPATLVQGAISPLASAFTSHFTLLPFALVLPALLLAEEHTPASLEAIHVVSLVEVSVLPLADSLAVRVPVREVPDVDLALLQRELSKALHLSADPVANVSLSEHVVVCRNLRR